MIRLIEVRRFSFPLAVALLAVLPWLFSPAPLRAGQESQQGQQDHGKDQKEKEQQPKKKGGFFGGLKKVTGGESGQETSATASAGAKSVGEGKQIGEVTPTAADRQAVTNMDNYSVPQGDLNKFIEDGHLKPKQ